MILWACERSPPSPRFRSAAALRRASARPRRSARAAHSRQRADWRADHRDRAPRGSRGPQQRPHRRTGVPSPEQEAADGQQPTVAVAAERHQRGGPERLREPSGGARAAGEDQASEEASAAHRSQAATRAPARRRTHAPPGRVRAVWWHGLGPRGRGDRAEAPRGEGAPALSSRVQEDRALPRLRRADHGAIAASTVSALESHVRVARVARPPEVRATDATRPTSAGPRSARHTPGDELLREPDRARRRSLGRH